MSFDYCDIMPGLRQKIGGADAYDTTADYYNLFLCHLST